MKRIFIFLLLSFLASGTLLQGQSSLVELKEQKQKMLDEQKATAEKIAALQNEIDEIKKSDGWRSGYAGVVGFNLNRSSNWAKNANPNGLSSGLSISGTGYAVKDWDKMFWRNTGIINLAWQKINTDTNIDAGDTGFDRVTDILNLSSLAGYKLSDAFALSGLAEINTSVGSFLSPGTFDLGLGGTYTGIENLVLVVHPLNMHVAFPNKDLTGLSTKTFIGTKLRADYSNTFANGISWSTNITAFTPYSGSFIADDNTEISAFEWTWLNTLTFPVWHGVGLGVSFGLRDAAFEYDGTQTFYTVGLSYNL